MIYAAEILHYFLTFMKDNDLLLKFFIILNFYERK